MDVNKFCGPRVSLAVKIQVGVLVKSYKQTTPDQQRKHPRGHHRWRAISFKKIGSSVMTVADRASVTAPLGSRKWSRALSRQ